MMRRAIREARKSRPSPSPRCGAVVVRDGRVVGVGHRARSAGIGAAAAALSRAGEAAKGATLYLTMAPRDPCDDDGLSTDALIAAGITRLVIGCLHPSASARAEQDLIGVDELEVVVGVESAAAWALIAGYASVQLAGRPRVTLKAALTLDGRMATRTGDSKWITGVPARAEAHRLRAAADAVIVGVGTAMADDPALTVRLAKGTDPLRVVLDSRARLPAGSQLARGAQVTPTLLLHGPGVARATLRPLQALGVQTRSVRMNRDGGLSPRDVLRILAGKQVLHVLLEGGPRVHGAFLRAGLVDDVALFYAPKLLGDAEAMPLCFGHAREQMASADGLESVCYRRLGVDWLITGQLRSKGRMLGSPAKKATQGGPAR